MALTASAEAAPGAARRGAHAAVGVEAAPAPPLTTDDVYHAHFDFVWRSVRRLGIRDDRVPDVVQDVFVVVHRNLPGFAGRSQLRTWLFGITLRVVRDHRRRVARKPTEPLRDAPAASSSAGPLEQAARREAAEFLHAFLDMLDEEKRSVFVLAELEQMSGPEIAAALGANLNTVYSRLRVARAEFEAAVSARAAREREVGR